MMTMKLDSFFMVDAAHCVGFLSLSISVDLFILCSLSPTNSRCSSLTVQLADELLGTGQRCHPIVPELSPEHRLRDETER